MVYVDIQQLRLKNPLEFLLVQLGMRVQKAVVIKEAVNGMVVEYLNQV